MSALLDIFVIEQQKMEMMELISRLNERTWPVIRHNTRWLSSFRHDPDAWHRWRNTGTDY